MQTPNIFTSFSPNSSCALLNFVFPLSFVQKFNFDFPEKIVDFSWVKNSWENVGLFSCWQLWFHEKNSQKIIECGQKIDFSNTYKSMHFRRKISKVRTWYNILNFPALLKALVGLPFCLPGRYCSTASAEKVRENSDFEIFFPEIHALVLDTWLYLICNNTSRN